MCLAAASKTGMGRALMELQSMEEAETKQTKDEQRNIANYSEFHEKNKQGRDMYMVGNGG